MSVFGAGVAALAAGIAAVAISAARGTRRRRAAELEELGRGLGWRFHADVTLQTVPDLERFEIFRRGRAKRMRNLLTSPPGATRLVVFDYTFLTGGGNSQKRHRQTLAYVTGDALSLPSFSLRPERAYHRVAAMLGFRDINFDDYPGFSSGFLLRGDDEPAIRAAFHRRLLEFFERRPGVCAAGHGRELLLWRPRRYARADEIEKLIEDANELAALFAAGR